MIFLGLIIALPTWLIAAIGGALIVGHNAFDGLRPTNALLAILHGPGFVVQREGFTIFASYPLIPWIGVTAVGYALAGIYAWTPERRRSWLLKAGLAAIAAFIAIRAINIYGDPAPWKAQATTLRTIASFINATKYPPSLLYVLMTLGPALLLLRWFENAPPRWTRPFIDYGRVPFFYYILHIFLIHLLATVAMMLQGQPWQETVLETGLDPKRYADNGFPLWVVYLVWIAVVTVLYFPCRWYARYRAENKEKWWLSYL